MEEYEQTHKNYLGVLKSIDTLQQDNKHYHTQIAGIQKKYSHLESQHLAQSKSLSRISEQVEVM